MSGIAKLALVLLAASALSCSQDAPQLAAPAPPEEAAADKLAAFEELADEHRGAPRVASRALRRTRESKKENLLEARDMLTGFLSLYPDTFYAVQVKKNLEDLPKPE